MPREFNFGAGNPDPGVFPSEDLAAAAQRVIVRLGKELAHYPDQRGLPELRAVAVERFERNHGVRVPIDDVVITNGAMQGLQLSAQGLAQRGDSVVLEEFEYGGTIRVFKQHGLTLLPVALDNQGMRMDDLEAVLERADPKPKFVYTTASYQNPTGTTQPMERRSRLLELARQHGIPVVEDDTYGDISFEPLAARAIYSQAKPGEAMYIGSFSKILGTGSLRLGFFIAPEQMRERLMPWKTDGGTSALAQYIAAEYLSANLWEHVEEGRDSVKAKRNALLDSLEHEFGHMGMSWTHPDGGLFLWIKLPESVDRVRLQELAVARGITYATGQAFHTLGQDVPYLRLAFGWIAIEDIPDGVRLLAECVREAMPAGALTS